MQENVVLRIGRPGLAVAGLVYVVLIEAAVMALVTAGVGSLWRDHRRDLAAIFLVLSPVYIAAVALFVWVVVVGPRRSRVWRPIELTTTHLRLPLREWADVPIGEISGVGLAQTYSGRSMPSWKPVFWRTNGSHTICGDVALTATGPDPTTTRAGRKIATMYAELTRLQGPLGPLTAQADQRHFAMSPWGDVIKVWDPGTAQVISAPPSASRDED